MERYADKSGNSGVIRFKAGRDFIKVWFEDAPAPYTYSYASAGSDHVERMKQLARAGEGLCTYITRNVKDDYERR